MTLPKIPQQYRAWAYRTAVAVGALLVAYKVISGDQLAVWLQVVAAVLMVGPAGLATVHTSTKDETRWPPKNAPKHEAGIADTGAVVLVIAVVALVAAVAALLGARL